MEKSDVSTQEIKKQLESMDISTGTGQASGSTEGTVPEVVHLELEPKASISNTTMHEHLRELNERLTGQKPPSKPVGSASDAFFDAVTGVWDIVD